MDGSVALLLEGVRDGHFGNLGRFLDGVAVAEFHHVAARKLRRCVGGGFAVDGGVERLALALFDHAAVDGHEVARLRLDAGGVQGVAEGFVASHVDAASVERDGGRQALHEQDAAAHESNQYENGECDGEGDARRALRRRGNGTRVRPRIRMRVAHVL